VFVLLNGRVVREIPRHEHGIRLRADCAHRVDRCGEPRHRLGAGPRGADMRIAELREEERRPAYETPRCPMKISFPSGSPTTAIRSPHT
jgi:hypothetical protein